MRELKKQIIEVLKSNPDSRNSDITLTIEVWKRYHPQKIHGLNLGLGTSEYVALRDLYDLPREDNVKRIRAKLAEDALGRILCGEIKGDEHYYLPTSADVARRRQINEEDWQRALGYFRRTARVQKDQLPNPVGVVVFSTVDMGSNGVRFLVRDGERSFEADLSLDGNWKCSCGEDGCGHIRAIKERAIR